MMGCAAILSLNLDTVIYFYVGIWPFLDKVPAMVSTPLNFFFFFYVTRRQIYSLRPEGRDHIVVQIAVLRFVYQIFSL